MVRRALNASADLAARSCLTRLIRHRLALVLQCENAAYSWAAAAIYRMAVARATLMVAWDLRPEYLHPPLLRNIRLLR